MGAIQVVAATDDFYACHLTVMLLSLFERSASPVDVHVLVPGQFQSRDKIAGALGKYAAHLTFHAVKPLEGLTVRKGVADATYYRLLIGDILPAALTRVIYLDSDMLICGDLSPLWQTELGDATVAAVIDPGFVQYAQLGISPSQPYFNAGMMVVDMARWRRDGVGKAALDFALSNPDRVHFDDQCALNWVLQDRWVQVPSIWNLQVFTLSESKHGHFTYPKHLRRNADGVRVVHFNSPGRPWTYMDEHPFKGDYLAFRARTPWREMRPADRFPHNMIVKTLLLYAPVLVPAYKRLRAYV